MSLPDNCLCGSSYPQNSPITLILQKGAKNLYIFRYKEDNFWRIGTWLMGQRFQSSALQYTFRNHYNLQYIYFLHVSNYTVKGTYSTTKVGRYLWLLVFPEYPLVDKIFALARTTRDTRIIVKDFSDPNIILCNCRVSGENPGCAASQ